MTAPAGHDGEGQGDRPWFGLRLDGLAARVVAYLSLALLPLGLIALYQTREFQRETEDRAELALLALTEQRAAGVGSALERALGVGEALSLLLPDLLADPEDCSRALRRLVESQEPFDFVGVLPAEGPVTCSSQPGPFEIGEDVRAEIATFLADPRVVVQPSDSTPDMLVVGLPLLNEDGAGLPAYLALTIPRDRIPAPRVPSAGLEPLRFVTINADGQILTGAPEGEAEIAQYLPQGGALANKVAEEPLAFLAASGAGPERFYTVVPVVQGLAYALGIWAPEQAALGRDGPRDWPLLFPLLMWGTSLVVAFWAIHQLVIRHVASLVARMRRFGRDRHLILSSATPGVPYELREIEDAFRHMADSILRDEARMENAFRERGVLLREVHHRVKNNLQLISSIISMQMRRLPEPRTRRLLRRLQDRVLTLASIYRSIYTSPDMGDVNAAPVIRAIVEQELRAAEGRVEVTLDIEDMVLDPDKVVPLSFLAAEAVSNAIARAGAPEGTRPSLSVTLHREGDRATLRIANSLAGPAPESPEAAQGLGLHLIQAFAAQVGGPVETEAGDRLYRLSVTFPIETAAVEAEPA